MEFLMDVQYATVDDLVTSVLRAKALTAIRRRLEEYLIFQVGFVARRLIRAWLLNVWQAKLTHKQMHWRTVLKKNKSGWEGGRKETACQQILRWERRLREELHRDVLALARQRIAIWKNSLHLFYTGARVSSMIEFITQEKEAVAARWMVHIEARTRISYVWRYLRVWYLNWFIESNRLLNMKRSMLTRQLQAEAKRSAMHRKDGHQFALTALCQALQRLSQHHVSALLHEWKRCKVLFADNQQKNEFERAVGLHKSEFERAVELHKSKLRLQALHVVRRFVGYRWRDSMRLALNQIALKVKQHQARALYCSRHALKCSTFYRAMSAYMLSVDQMQMRWWLSSVHKKCTLTTQAQKQVAVQRQHRKEKEDTSFKFLAEQRHTRQMAAACMMSSMARWWVRLVEKRVFDNFIDQKRDSGRRQIQVQHIIKVASNMLQRRLQARARMFLASYRNNYKQFLACRQSAVMMMRQQYSNYLQRKITHVLHSLKIQTDGAQHTWQSTLAESRHNLQQLKMSTECRCLLFANILYQALATARKAVMQSCVRRFQSQTCQARHLDVIQATIINAENDTQKQDFQIASLEFLIKFLQHDRKMVLRSLIRRMQMCHLCHKLRRKYWCFVITELHQSWHRTWTDNLRLIVNRWHSNKTIYKLNVYLRELESDIASLLQTAQDKEDSHEQLQDLHQQLSSSFRQVHSLSQERADAIYVSECRAGLLSSQLDKSKHECIKLVAELAALRPVEAHGRFQHFRSILSSLVSSMRSQSLVSCLATWRSNVKIEALQFFEASQRSAASALTLASQRRAGSTLLMALCRQLEVTRSSEAVTCIRMVHRWNQQVRDWNINNARVIWMNQAVLAASVAKILHSVVTSWRCAHLAQWRVNYFRQCIQELKSSIVDLDSECNRMKRQVKRAKDADKIDQENERLMAMLSRA